MEVYGIVNVNRLKISKPQSIRVVIRCLLQESNLVEKGTTGMKAVFICKDVIKVIDRRRKASFFNRILSL